MFKSPLVIQAQPGIGDVMWYLLHIRAIADQSPTKKVSTLTKQSCKANELLKNESIIDDYIYLKRDRRSAASRDKKIHHGLKGRWQLSCDLRPYHFNSVWILHHSTTYAHACLLAGIKERIGYTTHRYCHFLTNAVVIDKNETTIRQRSTLLLEKNSIDINHYDYPLQVKSCDQEKIKKLFSQIKLPIKIILGIGASVPEKCWPLDYFMVLTNWLLSQNYHVVLCGAESEQQDAAKIMQYFNHHPHLSNCTNQSLQETVAIIQQSTLYIGNDTSLMNIAVNQQKKSFVFFGPTYTIYSNYITPLVHPLCNLKEISVRQVQGDIKEYLFKNN